MEQTKVIELLNLIGFDSNEHDSIKTAIKEILDSEKYSPVMKGIVTDQKLLDEVRKIISAYNELKEVDEDMLNAAIASMSNSMEDNIENINPTYSLNEIIIDNTNPLNVVIRKKDENGIYNENSVIPSDKFKLHLYVYSIKGDGTYNLLGNKISDIDDCVMINPNIYKFIDNKGNISYINLDGRKILINNTNKNLVNIFESYKKLSDSTYDIIFNKYLESGLDYLSYDFIEITDKYLYCSKDKEICYFDMYGNKIITTEGDFAYIDSLPSDEFEDKRNIVVVGNYDADFKIVYGYYDLDNKQMIQSPKLSKAFPWASYITSAIDSDKHLNIYKLEDNNLIKVCTCFYEKSMYESGYLIPKRVSKLKDDIYLVDVSLYDSNHTLASYLLVQDITNNPKILLKKRGRFYEYDDNEFDDIFKSNILDDICACEKDRSMEVIKIKDGKLSISELTPKYICDNYVLDKNESMSISCVIASSDFLLPELKNKELTAESKKLPSLINDLGNISEDYKIDEKIRSMSLSNGQLKYKTLDDKYSVINSKNKKIFSENDNVNIISLLENGNIIIEAKYGNGKKKYVLDKNFNIVVGPVDDIFNCYYKNTLIVTDKGVKRLYQECIPISYEADNISMLTKYCVDDKGKVSELKRIFKVENKGNKFIADTDGDKILSMSQETIDLMNEIAGISNEALEVKVKRIDYNE